MYEFRLLKIIASSKASLWNLLWFLSCAYVSLNEIHELAILDPVYVYLLSPPPNLVDKTREMNFVY